jgi:hypothetical protein
MVQVAVKLFGMHSYNCGWHISWDTWPNLMVSGAF